MPSFVYDVFRFLCVLWLLPVTIPVWIVYILPAWGLGWITWRGWYNPFVALFTVATNRAETWYTRAWKDWAGWSGPCVILIREDHRNNRRTLQHEYVHCLQQFLFGPFFYPFYVGYSVYIWLFQKDKHAYLDNPFEVSARVGAGQQENIPKSEWRNGPNDRWPWW